VIEGRRRDTWFAPVHVIDLVVWYSVSAVVVFVVPTFARQGVPPWAMPPGDEIQAWYWTLAFVFAASGVTLLRATRGTMSLLSGGVLLVAPWALAFVALMLRSSVAQSRVVALTSMAIGVFLLAIPAVIPTTVVRSLFAAVVIVAVSAGARSMVPPPPPAASLTTISNTALVPLVIHYESGLVPVANVPGGAITTFGSGLLLATGAGAWYEVSWDSTGERLQARSLPLPAPMSRDGLAGAPYPAPLLRVTGVAVDTTSDTATVYVAHEVWDSGKRCIALGVSALRLRGLIAVDTAWRPVYVTEPCLATSQPGFDPYESGGRLLLLPDGALLMTVGDYGVNEDSSTALAQQSNADYGKTIRIDRGGKRTVYTMGHRNPSGLASDRDGNLWLAEHGPRGGDEINVLRAGANYGWPLKTYGTDYGRYRWRFTPPASSTRFTEPALVLVPSVAFSSLISVQGRLFEQWSGDLLAGSLGAKQLLRIRIEGQRAVYAEPIRIDRRIRDLAEAPDGRIVLWTDVGDLVWLTPSSDLLLGAVAYEACARCHGPANETDAKPTGPALGDIVGKRIASDPGFAFSDALKRVGGQWTEERLEAFLTSPSAFAPGTTMQFPGLPDSTQRRALVEYIRRGGG